jgi:para-nitrobenzyl esterase
MRRGSLSVLLFLAVSISVGLGRSESRQVPRVTVDSGVLAGTHFGSLPSEVAFLGVPFAAPPVGNLRWKPPQPPQKWQGIRDASQFAASCPQLPSAWWPEMAGLETLDTSEDCLYLNLWTTNFSKPAKQAVMVWIHGGGNVEGSSRIPPMGPALARKGVVVVSLDYRLGVLGYLTHPALTRESAQNASGNYGLLDQIAALRWVHANIAAFGGDPEAITIFGESSGAEDVCHLLASPLARGLFHRAILESGVCLDSLYSAMSKEQNYYGNHGSGEALGLRLAQQLGIPDHGSDPSALRALPAERLVKATKRLKSDFGVIIDDWVVPAQPALTFDTGRQAQVPILVGSNADEITVFGKASPLARKSSRPKTIVDYRKWLAREFREFADEVWREYPVKSDAATEGVFVRMLTDYEFGFGSYRLAKATFKIAQPAYLYYFNYTGRGRFKALGAFHSEEMMFLSESYWKSWRPDSNDKKLSGAMQDYWTQFAKTGNPNRPGLPDWPTYNSETEQCLEFGKIIQSEPIPHKHAYALFQRILDARLAEVASSVDVPRPKY